MLKRFCVSLLAIVLLISLGACSSNKVREQVIDEVKLFADATCSLKLTKIIDTIEVTKDSEELLDTFINGANLTSKNKAVYKEIISTLSYEIDEDSYVVSSNNDDAFVDVKFSMVDYHQAFEDETLQNEAQVITALHDEEDKIEILTTVRVYFDGDKWVIDNTKSVYTTLFEEVYCLNWTLLDKLANRIEYETWGTYFNTDFTNANEITCYLTLDSYDTDDDIKFYYELYYNDELIKVSEMKNVSFGLIEADEYYYSFDEITTPSGVTFIDSSSGIFLDGKYTFKFYDVAGECFYETSHDYYYEFNNYTGANGPGFTSAWIGTDDSFNTYLNPISITLLMEFDDNHLNLIVDSYYTVKLDEEVIYTSDKVTQSTFDRYLYYSYGVFFDECPVVSNDTGIMYPGDYTISVYDSNTDELIVEDTCHVLYGDDIVVELVTPYDGYVATISEDYYDSYFISKNYYKITNENGEAAFYYDKDCICCVVVSLNSYNENSDKYTYEYYLNGNLICSESINPAGYLNDTCYAIYEGEILEGSYEIIVYNPKGEVVTKVRFEIAE